MPNYYTTPINTRADLVLFGRWLQQQGFWVWEHPDFYKHTYAPYAFRVLPVHSSRSFHKYGLAIDVNWPNTAYERSKIINVVIPMCQRLGFSYIYAQYGTYGSAAGHTGHIHIDVGTSTNNGARYIRTPNKNIDVAAVLGFKNKPVTKRKPNDVTVNRWNQSPALTQVIQRILRAYDRSIKIDGKFGPHTEALVKRWQKGLGVKADGKVGPNTIKAYLNRHVRANGPLKEGNKSNAVRVVQYIIGASRDGQFGSVTKDRVRSAQAWAGLSADGVFGYNSIKKLVI